MLEHDQSLPAARESRWRQLCCRRAAPELATIIATMRCRVEHARGAQRLRGKRGREVKGGGAEGSEVARSVISNQVLWSLGGGFDARMLSDHLGSVFGW